MNLIQAIQNQTMSSRDIAKLCDKEHKNVIRVIRDLLSDKILDAQIEPLKFEYRGQEFDYYKLNKRDSIVVVARLNPAFMAKIIDRWDYLENKLIEKQNHNIVRTESKLEYRPMTNAIALAHEEIKPYHFSNEADLINRIVLGCTASKFRKENDILIGDGIRDYLTTLQLKCIIDLQRANTVYIEDGLDFQERKAKLQSLFDRKHKSQLIAEIHLINA